MTDVSFALSHSSALQREPSLSFLFCLPSCSSQETQSLSLAGLFCLRKGESHISTRLCVFNADSETRVNYPLLLTLHPQLFCFFSPLQVRFRCSHWRDHCVYIVLLPFPKTLPQLVVRPTRSVSLHFANLSVLCCRCGKGFFFFIQI